MHQPRGSVCRGTHSSTITGCLCMKGFFFLGGGVIGVVDFRVSARLAGAGSDFLLFLFTRDKQHFLCRWCFDCWRNVESAFVFETHWAA